MHNFESVILCNLPIGKTLSNVYYKATTTEAPTRTGRKENEMKNTLFGKLTEAEADVIGNAWYYWSTSKTLEAKKEKTRYLMVLLRKIAERHNTNIVTVWDWCFN